VGLNETKIVACALQHRMLQATRMKLHATRMKAFLITL
jgi:hypothetical protein